MLFDILKRSIEAVIQGFIYVYIFYIIMYVSNFKYINICIFISFFLNYSSPPGEDVVRRALRLKSHSPSVGEAGCKVSGSLIPVPASLP